MPLGNDLWNMFITAPVSMTATTINAAAIIGTKPAPIGTCSIGA